MLAGAGGHGALSRSVGAFFTPGPTGGGSSPGVSCGNADLAACGALTVVDANALASDSVVQTLPPSADSGERPGGCAEGAVPGRAWNMKGACMKENGAAGGRKKCSPAHLAKLGKVPPKASVEGAGNARGM